MRPVVLLREAAAAARAAIVPTILVAVVVAGTCLAALATVGRQAAAEAQLAEQLAGPAARTMTLTATGDGSAATPAVVAVLTGLRDAQAVVATELPRDAVNGALGAGSRPVAVTTIDGTVDQAIDVVLGRAPGPGEVVLTRQTMEALGLDAPAGYLEASDGEQWSVVGEFVARPPFEDLATTAVAVGRYDDADVLAGASFHTLRVVAADVAHVGAVQSAVLAVTSPAPREVQVTGATAGTAAGAAVAGTLSGFGRSLLLLILGAGAVFVATVVLADVLVRRRDLGRRRTLGITRGALVALVAVRTTVAAALGAVVGGVVGLVVVARAGTGVPVAFAAAVGILAVLTAFVACLPPAVFAARRDPVEVMRTP